MHTTVPLSCRRAFTLIELSIVLVIIGLIAGGVAVGKSLIESAAINAQITQIQKLHTDVNGFRDKFGVLPGDLNQVVATQFGFIARGSGNGQGDGNGLIQGNQSGVLMGNAQAGETLLFWIDLSTAKMIDQAFTSSASEATCECNSSGLAATALYNSYWPQAKLGSNNYVYVYSGGIRTAGYGVGTDGNHYFGVSTAPLSNFGHGSVATGPGTTVAQAYAIDLKIDDGLPVTGNVHPYYNMNGYIDYPVTQNPDTVSSCYNSLTGKYSISIQGAQLNCGLLFKWP